MFHLALQLTKIQRPDRNQIWRIEAGLVQLSHQPLIIVMEKGIHTKNLKEGTGLALNQTIVYFKSMGVKE